MTFQVLNSQNSPEMMDYLRPLASNFLDFLCSSAKNELLFCISPCQLCLSRPSFEVSPWPLWLCQAPPPLSFLLDNKLDTFGSTLHLANSAQRVVLQQNTSWSRPKITFFISGERHTSLWRCLLLIAWPLIEHSFLTESEGWALGIMSSVDRRN